MAEFTTTWTRVFDGGAPVHIDAIWRIRWIVLCGGCNMPYTTTAVAIPDCAYVGCRQQGEGI